MPLTGSWGSPVHAHVPCTLRPDPCPEGALIPCFPVFYCFPLQGDFLKNHPCLGPYIPLQRIFSTITHTDPLLRVCFSFVGLLLAMSRPGSFLPPNRPTGFVSGRFPLSYVSPNFAGFPNNTASTFPVVPPVFARSRGFSLAPRPCIARGFFFLPSFCNGLSRVVLAFRSSLVPLLPEKPLRLSPLITGV